ncbi:sulfotransferase 1B1 [Plutella xylostella]|uniref:sulfotransferase 1B1 n=1 Tax=Plutella xylostella TaxID=51655 RepID=UPI0020322A60|nr:sulfotransferase 1B1 [Plutella xylostella]
MDAKNNNVLPFEIRDVEPELADELMKYFTGELTGFVQVGPKRYFLPNKYKQEARNIYNMPVRPTDIFVASYPRSGTTWTQELVWMVANDLDYEKSDAIPLTERYPFLEFSIFVHPIMKERFREENKHSPQKLKLLELVSQPGTEQLAAVTGARFIKTHLPLSLLPPALLDHGKMVYVARDPRDVVVSFYHLNRSMRTQGYVGDFKTYWNYFIRDLHHWTPYFDHLKEAWEKRHHPNMLFLFYEELSKDLPAAVRRVSTFLNKRYSEDQIQRLCRHLSVDSFKSNKSVNYDVMSELGIMVKGEGGFIRKGKAGGWREHFDEEMAQQAERWISDNLRGTDFRFPHMDKEAQ